MFLFIFEKAEAITESIEFKYISCFYLSIGACFAFTVLSIQIHLMFLFIHFQDNNNTALYYSNTSHVSIYPGAYAKC